MNIKIIETVKLAENTAQEVINYLDIVLKQIPPYEITPNPIIERYQLDEINLKLDSICQKMSKSFGFCAYEFPKIYVKSFRNGIELLYENMAGYYLLALMDNMMTSSQSAIKSGCTTVEEIKDFYNLEK